MAESDDKIDGRAGPYFAYGTGMPNSNSFASPVRLLALLALLPLIAASACSRGESAADTEAETAKAWAPEQLTSVNEVPAAAITAAMETKLAEAAPTTIDREQWSHTKALYKAYGTKPLWLTSKGLHETRTRALTDAILAVHSDAMRIDDYPIGRLAAALAAVKGAGNATAEQLAEADVMLTASYAALGEDLLTGQINPKTVSQSWFVDPHEENVDSVLGGETLEALNKPAQYRLAQIAANMERFRWLPRSLGSRYIFVNVPAFRLEAYDGGKIALEMKVIVGQEYEDRATPVFSDSMEYVVFRPYWLVPPGIAEKEIFPKGPGYLAANNMEVYRAQGETRVRQLPGEDNALGQIKFMFPNDFNIYLHDTPNRELFKEDVRAFSHGCIRVERPDRLANFVLGWPQDRIDNAMNSGADDQSVRLPKKIPVYIAYITTYMRGGQLYFGNDLYARDDRLMDAVAPAAMPTAKAVEAVQALRRIAER